MKKILLSITSIIFAGAILATGTGAYLSDTEKSTGNTFATGVIDLKIDNESYITNEWGKLVYSTSTSWELSPLAGKFFFNFLDIKPGDIGEDTISLHVNNNNAWACMNILLTATPENGQNEPESLVDVTTGENSGELQDKLYFKFWADDGDNVYEIGEKIFKKGLVKDIWNGENWAIADSNGNIWGGDDPLIGNSVRYIGKAWCFGDMQDYPVTQDGLGKTGNNGPLVRGTGFKCEGEEIGNIVQSDGVKADVTFSVIQSRGNDGFICGNDEEEDKSTVTLCKTDETGKPLSGWTLNLNDGLPGNIEDYSGVTLQNGCVAFTGVSYGTHEISEVLQEGWEHVSGAGGLGVIVNDPTETFIVVNKLKVEEENNQYCSHGYWKASQHFDSWSGYSPNQLYSSVFDNAFPGKTLLQVLQLGGGGLNQLGRETVVALLNAGSLDFPYSQAQVISMFNGAYPGTNTAYSTLVGQFVIPENCPLN